MQRIRSRKGAPGIIEVAKRAGVSPATVSRFFNTPDVVKPPTRTRIQQAAEDLGYIRDRMAGSLHNRFSGTIGLVVPTIDNAIFAELIQAFSAQLRRHDRTMLIAAHGYDLALEVLLIRSLLERRIDGIAMIGLEHNIASLEMLATRHVPVLAAWNYRDDSPISCVGANNFDAGFRVSRYLVEHGHHDVAFLFPPTHSNDRAYDRLHGALAGLNRSLQDLPANRNVETAYDIGVAKKTAIDLLRHDPPSAIICGNDIIAQGVIYACQFLKILIPDELSVIGIGDFRGSAHMEPALTTLRLPARRIAEIAADQLCSTGFQSKHNALKRTLVPAELIERQSVGFLGKK